MRRPRSWYRRFKGPGQGGDRNGNWKGGVSAELYRYVRLFKKSNPEKVRAHKAVAYAKREGLIAPEPCEGCGSTKVHAHHDDYSKVLDVRWLCRACHRAWHAANDRPMGHRTFPQLFPGKKKAPRAATLEAKETR